MKRSIPVSAALLAAEGSLLFSVPEMTGWQGTPLLLSGGILTILICGTAYFLFSKLAEWKENQNQFDFHLQELNEIMKKMQKSHEIPISEMTELFTSKIGEMQNQFSQNAAHADEVQESAKELYQAGIQQIQEFQQKQSELLTENQKTMISEMTGLFTSKIGEMQNQFSQNAAHADEVQESAKELYQAGIQQIQEFQQKQTASLTELFASKIGEMQNQFSQNAAHADEVQKSVKELYQTGIQQMQETQQKQVQLLTENQKTMISEMAELFTSKIGEMQNQFSQNAAHADEVQEDSQTMYQTSIRQMQEIQQKQTASLTELFTSKIGEMQHQFSQNAAHADEVQESAKELYQAGIQQIQKFQQKQSELLTENQKTMISEMTELFTSKIGEMQHQFSQNAAHADEVQKAAKGLYQTGIQQMQETQQKQAECINTAYQKIAVLAEKNTETENQIQRVSENLIEIAETIQSSIEKNAVGIAETFQASMEENAESLHEQQEEYYNNMEEIIEEKLSDYNSAFNKMKDALQSILIEVQHNTEQYQKTLNEILEAQNAMNSLTEQDLRILKGILK